jgi:cytochrome bd-type quinol oxidase subunit 2
MSFHQVLGYLVIAASTTLGSFIVAVGLDILAGITLALRQGKFYWNRLPSWLGDQFATKEFLGVVTLGVTAGLAALGSSLQGGLTEQALQTVAQVALAAATAGAAAMMASVLSDAFGKVQQLFGAPAKPVPPVPPTPVVVVPATPVLPVAPQATPVAPPAGT